MSISARTRSRRAALVLAVAAATFAASTGAAAAQPGIQPCINYVHTEPGGRVQVDLRRDRLTGRESVLTVWWFINDVGAPPGIYQWSHVVNGVPRSLHVDLKDDNLHTGFRSNEDGGWKFGDRYKFQATHYSAVTRTTYVSAVNECIITPR